jgi:stringent starvation protein B
MIEMMNALDAASTRPYLIRAIYEWCTDHGFTPYIAVRVDETVQVPRESVKNGEVVLNISFDATGSLQLGNEFIEFKARFAGVARDIVVPITRVMAIYARENGQGMAFPILSERDGSLSDGELSPAAVTQGALRSAGEATALQLVPGDRVSGAQEDAEPEPPKPPANPRPALKRIK